jgi:hypothetical protein
LLSQLINQHGDLTNQIGQIDQINLIGIITGQINLITIIKLLLTKTIIKLILIRIGIIKLMLRRKENSIFII